jgi:ABC-type iron transport system FetAB permease component
MAVSYILKEFQENKDKIEIYLAFGATRMEACRPLAVQG